MDYDAMLKQIELAGDFRDRVAARDAAEAVLSVLGEHLVGGEPENLAAQLPPELAQALPPVGGAQRFDVLEFDRRVAAREPERCTPGQAHLHAVAVLNTVLGSVTAGEREHVSAQLPGDFREFIP